MRPPAPGDHRVVKHKYDAIHDTDLDPILRNSGVDTLIIAGVTTECCCESTARGAFSRDYKVVFVRDAMASLDPAAHEQACARVDLLFGRACTTAEVVHAIASGKRDGGRRGRHGSERSSLSCRVASTSTSQRASSITTP
jgi:ureidoacrylate peracid hydrolase